MTDNAFDTDKARLGLVACEARAKQLKKLVEEYDFHKGQFDSLYTPLHTSARPALRLPPQSVKLLPEHTNDNRNKSVAKLLLCPSIFYRSFSPDWREKKVK